MIAPLGRIFAIARTTLIESLRQRVLAVLLVFAIILVAASVGGSSLSTTDIDSSILYSEQIKFVKDVGSGAISIFGFAIAVLSVAQLLPQELQNRTIYTILAKPVRRSEFLLGKFFGVVLLLALCTSLMALAFAVALYFQQVKDLALINQAYGVGTPAWEAHKEALMPAYQHDTDGLRALVEDPQLVAALLLIFAKLVMAAAIGLVVSTFSTSAIFTVVTTTMVYLIGHLEGAARIVYLGHGAETSIWMTILVGFICSVIPDMNSFTIVDEILAGNVVPWAHTFNLLGYAGVYLLILLGLSVIIFEFREI